MFAPSHHGAISRDFLRNLQITPHLSGFFSLVPLWNLSQEYHTQMCIQIVLYTILAEHYQASLAKGAERTEESGGWWFGVETPDPSVVLDRGLRRNKKGCEDGTLRQAVCLHSRLVLATVEHYRSALGHVVVQRRRRNRGR